MTRFDTEVVLAFMERLTLAAEAQAKAAKRIADAIERAEGSTRQAAVSRITHDSGRV